MTIGEAIRTARESRGFTITKLSEKSGVHYETIWNWEKDKVIPSVFLLSCIADVLEISLDELVGRKVKNNGFDKIH